MERFEQSMIVGAVIGFAFGFVYGFVALVLMVNTPIGM